MISEHSCSLMGTGLLVVHCAGIMLVWISISILVVIFNDLAAVYSCCMRVSNTYITLAFLQWDDGTGDITEQVV